MCVCVCIYIYIERERERERDDELVKWFANKFKLVRQKKKMYQI